MIRLKKINTVIPLLLTLGLIPAAIADSKIPEIREISPAGTQEIRRNTLASEICIQAVPLFGAAFTTNIFSQQRKLYKYGLPLAYIKKDSPAENAGLREGDVLLTVDGQKIFYANQFAALIRTYKPGDKIKIEFARGDEILSRTLELGTRYGQAVERAPGNQVVPAIHEKDDVRLIVNGREISLSQNSEWCNRIAVTPDAVIIRTNSNFPGELQKAIERFRARLPSPAEISNRIGTAMRSFQSEIVNGVHIWRQVFSNGRDTVIFSVENGKREVIVRAKKQGEIFRGPCTTHEEIEAIPEEIQKIIRSFTPLNPIKPEKDKTPPKNGK